MQVSDCIKKLKYFLGLLNIKTKKSHPGCKYKKLCENSHCKAKAKENVI